MQGKNVGHGLEDVINLITDSENVISTDY